MQKVIYIILLLWIFLLWNLIPYEINGFLRMNVCNKTKIDFHYVQLKNKVWVSHIRAGECSEYKYVGNLIIPIEIDVLTKEGDLLYKYNTTPYDTVWMKRKIIWKQTLNITELNKTDYKRTEFFWSILYNFE